MDKLPPHSPEAERALIGAALTDPKSCIPQIQASLPDDNAFYELNNRLIWRAIQSIRDDGVDLMTVSQKLKDLEIHDKIGGYEYLTKCQDECISTANISEYIAIVQGKFTKRKIIATCTKAVAESYQDESADELLARIESEVLKIRPQQRVSNDIRFLVNEAINKLEEKAKNGDLIMGIPTGLTDLDRLTDGCHKGEMIVIAGFPSTGKTALAVNIAIGNALAKIPVAIFSAEMRPVQIVVRSLCAEARVNYHKLKGDEQAQQKLMPQVVNISKSPIYIESAHGMTIGQVMATARRLKQQHDIQMIVVDYIQLLQGVGDNREQQVSSISKGCKAMALELDLPVLALSQLTDDGKLRESRAIGQDADSIWKLENDGDWKPDYQPVNLFVEKCRDGETGKVALQFVKLHTRFENTAKINEEDVPKNYKD